MLFTKNEAGTVAGSAIAEAASPTVSEIDLYDELITFAGLSPEEQLRVLARLEKPVEVAVEPPSDSVVIQGAEIAGNVEATDLRTETIPELDSGVGFEISQPSSGVSEGPGASGSLGITSPTPAQAFLHSDDAAGVEPSGSLEPSSPTAVEDRSDSDVAASNVESSGSSDNPSPPVAQAQSESGDSTTIVLKNGMPVVYDRSRTGPLLAGLNVIPEFVFAGDLTLGVCLSCGAESGADDLFCVSCGLFIDEIGSTPPKSSPACVECGQIVASDEIFCPWCGAAPGME